MKKQGEEDGDTDTRSNLINHNKILNVWFKIFQKTPK